MSYQSNYNYRDNSTRPTNFNMRQNSGNNAMLEKAEELANNCLQSTKHYLPHIARACLVSTFIEDGIRMLYQWGEQRDYIASTWNVGSILGTMFVLLNLVGQIGASILILARKQVDNCCYALFGIIILQTLAYSILWDLKFLARSLSLVGAVLLILAENKKDKTNVFRSVPMMNDPSSSTRNYLMLGGRVLLVLMFLSLLKFNGGAFDMIRNIVGICLIAVILVGFKTKLFSVVMVSWLMVLNAVFNDFWRHRSSSIMYDFKKYDFFQTMTVIGGLLFLLLIGPGGLSLDERKKMY